jgi:hypothetical protein
MSPFAFLNSLVSRLISATIDPQGDRFYAWEFDLEVADQSPLPFSQRPPGSPFAPALTLAECTECAQVVFAHYGCRPLPIVPGSKDGLFAWSNRREIGLPPLARNYCTILHEVAHVLCTQLSCGAEHDAGFVGLYLELLHLFLGLDFPTLLASARSYGLQVAIQPKSRERSMRAPHPTLLPLA